MNIKNTLGQRFLIGLTVLGLTAGLGSSALAQQAHDPARPHAAQMHEKMAQHHAMLHEKLKLTAAQEPAWVAFGASMRSGAKPGERGVWMDRAALRKMSAPERMEARIAMSKERLSRQETRLTALKSFYATLTPEQQKVFDDNMRGGEHGSRHGHKMRSSV
jgi:Spy/CpxP family protein refolding chaperone